MPANERRFAGLHRLFLNGRPGAAGPGGRPRGPGPGGDDDPCGLGPPLSAAWLPPGADFPAGENDAAEARGWRAILNGIARMAAIVYGSGRYRVLVDAAFDATGYDGKPRRRNGRLIVVSTEPVRRPMPGFSFYDAVDAMVGQVIHEAAHGREGREEEPFADDEILSLLHHLVEDVLNDQIVALEYPGFEGYLLKYRRYFIDWKLRGDWGFRAEGRLRQLVLAMRSTYPVRVTRRSVRRAHLYLLWILARHRTAEELRRVDRVRTAEELYAILYDSRFAEHTSELDVLSESLILGPDGPPVRGEKGNRRGGRNNASPVTRAALRRLNPPAFAWSDRALEAFSARRTKAGKTRSLGRWSGEFRHRAHPSGRRSAVSPEGYRRMCRLAEEVRSRRVAGEGVRYEAAWLREAPHAQAEARYRSAVEAVRGPILRLRNRLAWVNAGAGPDRIALTAGELDEEALYRAKYAADLFRRREDGRFRVPPLDLVLLADASLSMKEPLPGGDLPKYIVAQRLAALFVEALEPLAPIRAWVFSYSSAENRVELRELYAPGRHAGKTRIGDLYPAGQTPEYGALAAVSRFIREAGRPGVPKVYIVVSDGRPDDDILPRDAHIAAIRRLASRLRAEGDAVVHVALSPQRFGSPVYPVSLRFPEEGHAGLIRRFGLLVEALAAARAFRR